MSNRIQIRRGTNANRLTLSGTSDIRVGELLFATDTKRVFIGDGSTTGGYDFVGATITAATIAVTQLTGTANAVVALNGAGVGYSMTGTANQVLTLNASAVPTFAGITYSNVNPGDFITDLSSAPGANKFVDAATIRAFVLAQASSMSWRPPVDLKDNTNTTLPTGDPVTIDGVNVANGDRVLFTNLSSNNNRVYKATASGSNVTAWTLETDGQAGTGAPTDGDTIYVERGTSQADRTYNYTGTAWVLVASLNGSLLAANNLSDVANANTARINLGAISASSTDTLTNKTIDGDNNTLVDIGYASLKQQAAGSLLYWNGSMNPTLLSIGTTNQILTVSAGGLPVWSTFSTLFPNYVQGPASAADNEVVRYDGTTGKLIQDGTVARLDDNTTLGGDTVAPLSGVALDGGVV